MGYQNPPEQEAWNRDHLTGVVTLGEGHSHSQTCGPAEGVWKCPAPSSCPPSELQPGRGQPPGEQNRER